LIARADGTDTLAEAAENNNAGSAALKVGVDLVVSALSGPAAAGPGESITLSETTRQQGGGTAPASVTHYLLSTDAVADSGDTLLGSRGVPQLASGASSSASTLVAIPPGTPVGAWYVIAKADGDGSIAEVSESNNTATWTLQLGADLVISSVSAPASSGAGQSVTLTDTTRNQGSAAPATVTQYYLSANTTYEAADIALGTRSVPALANGASHTGSVTLSLPTSVATGTWYILARADGADTLAEISEANNTNWRSIQIGPDLSVWSVSAPAAAGPGQTITVSDTISNSGGGSAAASAVQYYLSSDAAFDAADAVLGSRNVPAIAAGASNSGSASLTLPATLGTGNWYILARADAGGAVAELNESNNVAARGFQVGPDLVVSTLSAPAVGAAGRTLTISDSVRNQGGAAAPASTTRYYLSSNTSLDASDVAIGSASVPALAAGATSSASVTLGIPADIATGAWYLIAQADGAGEITETAETNNTNYRYLQIGVDLAVSALSAPASAAAGQTIAVSDTTRNQGAGLAPASSTQFFLSANSTLDATDTLLGARALPALDTGASSAGATPIALPATLSAGVWFVIAKADAEGAVTETSEVNNTSYWSVQVGPDLMVYSATVPATAVAGQSLAIGDTIRNLGAADAPASVAHFYLSRDSVLDAGDRLLGARGVPAMAAGTLQSGTTTLTLPADTAAGGSFLLVKADGEGSIAESSETNNVVWRWFTVSAAP
jgi:subtilase family serine protease